MTDRRRPFSEVNGAEARPQSKLPRPTKTKPGLSSQLPAPRITDMHTNMRNAGFRTTRRESFIVRPPPGQKTGAQGVPRRSTLGPSSRSRLVSTAGYLPATRSKGSMSFTKAQKRDIARLTTLPPKSHTVRVEADEETKRQIEEGKRSQQELRSELNEMKKLFQSAQASAANAGDIELLRAKLVSVERDLREKDSEVTRLKLETMQKQTILEAAKADLESRLRSEQEKRQPLEQKVAEYNTAIAVLEAEKSVIVGRLDGLKIENENLRKTSDEKMRATEELQSTLEHIRQSIGSEIEKREAAERFRAEAEDKIKDLSNQTALLENELKDNVSQLSLARTEKEELTKEKIKLESALKLAKESIKRERERLIALQQELELSKATHGSHYASLKAEYEKYKIDTRNELKNIESAKHAAEGARSTTQNELKAFQSTCDTYKSVIASQESAIAALNAKVSTAEIRCKASAQEAENRALEIENLGNTIKQQLSKITKLEEQAREDEDARRKLHNMVQELKGNIRVYCRVRPRVKGEDAGSEEELYQFGDRHQGVVALQPRLTLRKNTSGSALMDRQKWNFKFDYVFGPHAKQENVFDEISQLVQSALDGYKVCIFAYGQTGSGKTYTMLGGDAQDEENLGMIPRSVRQIFDSAERLGKDHWEFSLKASFLEIYNETVRDLLTDSRSPEDGKKSHTIKFSPETGLSTVTDLTIVEVDTPEQVRRLIKKSIRNRATAATRANERSSRSHSVFRMQITGRNKLSGQNLDGLLNLIDLAGSERLKVSGARGERLKETQHINKSLSALGDVIASLANKEKHIPFRNSKLTYLLQDSLGGDSKTLMFVNVSPSAQSFNESLCSLRFASKVNACDIGTARRSTKIDLSI